MFLGEPCQLALQLSHCFEVVPGNELLALFFHQFLELLFRFHELRVLLLDHDGILLEAELREDLRRVHHDVANSRDGHQTIREALDDLAAHEAGGDARI